MPGRTSIRRSLTCVHCQCYLFTMPPAVFYLFFFATAPIALMPSIISLLTRHRARVYIVPINLALWAVIFFAAKSFTIGTSSKFQLPTLIALAVWLVLLGFSIRGESTRRRAQQR